MIPSIPNREQFDAMNDAEFDAFWRAYLTAVDIENCDDDEVAEHSAAFEDASRVRLSN